MPNMHRINPVQAWPVQDMDSITHASASAIYAYMRWRFIVTSKLTDEEYQATIQRIAGAV